MQREDGKRETPAPKVAAKPTAKPQYNAPAWKKQAARPKPKDERDDEEGQTRPAYVPPGLSSQQRPTASAQFTTPAWWNKLSDGVSNWIDNNVSGSQYVPAGLSQPQRPTTAAQFKPPVWGGNPMRVSEPSDPSLPTGTFFSGGSTQDGTRLVPTGQNTSMLLGGGGIRNNGTVRIAKGIPMIGAPSQPTTTTTGYSGWGTTYKKYGGGGGNNYSTYSSAKVPSWLMNLYNWNFRG